MTEQTPEHTEFDELAAGYALSALEPADEQRFLQHAVDCPDCTQTMAEFGAVAAMLAETAPPAEPSEQLGLRIMAAIRPAQDARGQSDVPLPEAPTGEYEPKHASRPPQASTGAPDAAKPADVVPLRPRWARRQRWLAAAAAVVIAAGGVWGGLAATSGNAPAPLAACQQPHRCPEVTLVTKSHQTEAQVVVLDGQAWMRPTGMSATPADHVYVLWQIVGSHAPQAVGAFEVKTEGTAPIKVGGLVVPYAGTSAFAVSLEPGHTAPAAPSDVLAAGDVS